MVRFLTGMARASLMVIAVALTEGIRWTERTVFPWRLGQ